MSELIYEGPFKEHIQNHVELKRAVGYQYDADAAHLKRFDQFTLEKYTHANFLTKEIVLDWCSKKTYEAQANQCSRASILRQFGKYLDSIGIKAYVLPKGYYPTEKQYMPYIYTADELTRFFAETDKCRYCYESPYRHLIMPLFFRMVYTCGLRVSEARLLKVEDVDLTQGILSIHHSKKDNSRLIPMSDTLTARCRCYSENVHPFQAVPVRLCKKQLHSLRRQMLHDRFGCLLQRDRNHFLKIKNPRRLLILYIPEEGVYGSEPLVSGRNAAFSF